MTHKTKDNPRHKSNKEQLISHTHRNIELETTITRKKMNKYIYLVANIDAHHVCPIKIWAIYFSEYDSKFPI